VLDALLEETLLPVGQSPSYLVAQLRSSAVGCTMQLLFACRFPAVEVSNHQPDMREWEIYKKVNSSHRGNVRLITLLQTLYKLYLLHVSASDFCQRHAVSPEKGVCGEFP